MRNISFYLFLFYIIKKLERGEGLNAFETLCTAISTFNVYLEKINPKFLHFIYNQCNKRKLPKSNKIFVFFMVDLEFKVLTSSSSILTSTPYPSHIAHRLFLDLHTSSSGLVQENTFAVVAIVVESMLSADNITNLNCTTKTSAPNINKQNINKIDTNVEIAMFSYFFKQYLF